MVTRYKSKRYIAIKAPRLCAYVNSKAVSESKGDSGDKVFNLLCKKLS